MIISTEYYFENQSEREGFINYLKKKRGDELRDALENSSDVVCPACTGYVKKNVCVECGKHVKEVELNFVVEGEK